MDFQRSRIQPRKKIKIGDDAKHDVLEAACGDDFWKKAPEDILLEIFIRLPDSRSAIRTAAVCHKWHSLISQNPQFIPRFISHHHQHQHRYPLPYTIFFRKADDTSIFKPFAGSQFFQPICKLFSDQESMFCTSPNFLDFIMPCSSPMVIRGTYNDLLLVSPGSREPTHLYICNPITKQFIQLPEVPRHKHPGFEFVAGHALVCMPGPTNKSRFKVVEFRYSDYADPGLPQTSVQPVMLFCSESRKWEMRHFHYPRPTTDYFTNWLHSVACKGILYWLEFEHFGVNRVHSLDLSNSQCGVIDFPNDSHHELRHARDQIGVVRSVRGEEELRLLQVVLTKGMESTVDLKVWKLSHNDHTDKKEWVLVYHKNKLEKPNRKKYHARPFVHPTNGDVVFMVWGRKVYQYNLKDTNTSTYELIGKLQKRSAMLRAGWVAPTDRLLQFPVVHTNWPTQICLT